MQGVESTYICVKLSDKEILEESKKNHNEDSEEVFFIYCFPLQLFKCFFLL